MENKVTFRDIEEDIIQYARQYAEDAYDDGIKDTREVLLHKMYDVKPNGTFTLDEVAQYLEEIMAVRRGLRVRSTVLTADGR